MKQSLLATLLLLLPGIAPGQISLELSDLESLYGTRQQSTHYKASTLTGADAIVAATGEDQNWDFNLMNWALDGVSTIDYLTSFTGIPGADDSRFSRANLVTQIWDVANPTPDDTTVYIFQRVTPTALSLMGLSTTGDIDDVPPSPDTLLLVNTPLFTDQVIPTTYGTLFHDSTGQTIEINGDPFGVTSFVNDVEFDGWGTLVLPSGSYDALRSRWTVKITAFSITSTFYFIRFNTKNLAYAAIETNESGNPLNAEYQDFETILPVELANFRALFDKGVARLHWETLSENNNSGFALEHALPGMDYRDALFIPGAGTSSERHYYQHEVNIDAPGTHRFRLRQIDVSGSYAFSQIVEVTAPLNSAVTISAPYPNPSTGDAAVHVAVQESQPVRVELYNALGQSVQVLLDRVVEGGEVVNLTVDGSSLASGMYFVRLRGKGVVESKSLMLVR